MLNMRTRDAGLRAHLMGVSLRFRRTFHYPKHTWCWSVSEEEDYFFKIMGDVAVKLQSVFFVYIFSVRV